MNHTLEQLLRADIHYIEWHIKILASIALSYGVYNNTTHDTIGHSPFEVTHTYQPQLGYKPMNEKSYSAKQLAQHNKKVLKNVYKHLKKIREQMVKQLNKFHSPTLKYKVANYVWLSAIYICSSGCRKLAPRWVELFQVLEIKSNTLKIAI